MASNKTNLLTCFHIISWTCHTGLGWISLVNHCLALAYSSSFKSGVGLVKYLHLLSTSRLPLPFISAWGRAKPCLIATPCQQLLPHHNPHFFLMWHNCKLKRKLSKLPLPFSLQIQHRATAGQVTRIRSPGRLCHTKRKQNWKLHALIPIAILQCLRKVNSSVPKNKTIH